MVVSVLGPQYLVDLVFLHQRGRAFTVLHLALNFGASAGPTFSGFIAAHHYWPVEYWWSVALLGVTAILVFCFLEETGFDRRDGAINIIVPRNFVNNRVYTFIPGSKVVKKTTLLETVRIFLPLPQMDADITRGKSRTATFQDCFFSCDINGSGI